MINIYNSLTKNKEIIKPITPGNISLYVCGITVYDECHIGHARVFLVFDAFVRYLLSNGYTVNYVRNVTDIDDKIIQRAKEYGVSPEAHAAIYTRRMQEDEQALGILQPTQMPKATEYVPQIIEFIEKLIAMGHAYVTNSGCVYFNVQSFPQYGQLSYCKLDDLQIGDKIENSAEKHSELDFALWKSAKPDEPKWSSPWGEGRPGWHIECSAMALHCLGDHFDIHGGGNDLKFPHHENECAQSQALTAKPFVNYWMHVGYVEVNSEKMAKSLGNMVSIREVLQKYDSEVVRYFMLSSHYRSPIEYNEKNIDMAADSLRKLYIAIRGLSCVDIEVSSDLNNYKEAFQAALADDFNTVQSFVVLVDISKNINKLRAEQQIHKASQLAILLKQLGNSLGILQKEPNDFLQQGAIDKEIIEESIKERNIARINKDWLKADQIREELLDKGVILEDSNGKTRWRFD